jgi:hypothetical protein
MYYKELDVYILSIELSDLGWSIYKNIPKRIILNKKQYYYCVTLSVTKYVTTVLQLLVAVYLIDEIRRTCRKNNYTG